MRRAILVAVTLSCNAYFDTGNQSLHRRKIARKPLLLPKEWQRGENK
jgi:hypothetical protein